jgi:hypothetical protein
MSTCPARIERFIQELQREGALWTIHGTDGMPVFQRESGLRASPFWCSEEEAVRFVQAHEAFEGFEPVCITWLVFRSRWIPGLNTDELLIDVAGSQDASSACDIAPSVLEVAMRSLGGSWQPARAVSVSVSVSRAA